MNDYNALAVTALTILALCCVSPAIAQDTPAAPTMSQPGMPMMGMQRGTMPMMQGRQGAMPMMPGCGGRYGMHMPGPGGPGTGMQGCQHDCQHRGKHHGGDAGKGMRHQRHEMMQAHRQAMEERLARIEALLQQLVDRQQP